MMKGSRFFNFPVNIFMFVFWCGVLENLLVVVVTPSRQRLVVLSRWRISISAPGLPAGFSRRHVELSVINVWMNRTR